MSLAARRSISLTGTRIPHSSSPKHFSPLSANMSTLAEYCLPYVRTGGYFVAYKASGFTAAESGTSEYAAAAKALKLLGGTAEQVTEYCLPESGDPRCLAVIKKTAPTPKKYPRKAGLPAKEPL